MHRKEQYVEIYFFLKLHFLSLKNIGQRFFYLTIDYQKNFMKLPHIMNLFLNSTLFLQYLFSLESNPIFHKMK